MLQIANKIAYLMWIFVKLKAAVHSYVHMQGCCKMVMQICKTVWMWPCISHVNFIVSRTFCSILGAAVQ